MQPINIHYVTGNKGNVGKTNFSTALIEYYRQCNCGLIAIDADDDSKTLSQTYKNSLKVLLSEKPALASQVDIVFRLAFAETEKEVGRSDLLLDLPAGGEKIINKWMKECSLDQTAKEYNIKFTKWWVCDSDPLSIDLFQESIEKQPDVDHIFLKNMGRSEDVSWKAFERRASLKALIEKKSIPVLEIPALDPEAISRIRTGHTTLERAAHRDYLKVNVTDHLRVKGWLMHTNDMIKNIITLDEACQIVVPKVSETAPDKESETAETSSEEEVSGKTKETKTTTSKTKKKASAKTTAASKKKASAESDVSEADCQKKSTAVAK